MGRAGHGLPTAAHLDFQAAHAAARDAVHAALDVAALRADLDAAGLASFSVHSEAAGSCIYLLRPDLGRRLREADRAQLPTPPPIALLFVVCDGLSSIAVRRHAALLLSHVSPLLRTGTVAPIVVAEQGRVALGDDIGEAMGAEAVAVLIGERPGLSAADSLGIYLTWQPRAAAPMPSATASRTSAPTACLRMAAAKAALADRSDATAAPDRRRT